MQETRETDALDDKLDPPPPYSEQDPAQFESSSSQNERATTDKVPSSIGVYLKRSHAWLGRHSGERLFAVSRPVGSNGVTIYDGPSNHYPVLVTSTRQASKHIITIPNGRTPIRILYGRLVGSGNNVAFHHRDNGTHRFSMEVGVPAGGSKPRVEAFEWRKCVVDEESKRRGITTESRLVRMHIMSSAIEGSSSFEVDEIEVVASVIHSQLSNSFLSTDKMADVYFTGSGLSGTLGDQWKRVALMSSLLC